MAAATSRQWSKWIRRAKPLVFVLCAIPACLSALLLYRFVTGSFFGDPIEDLTRNTGIWGIRLLLLTLAITPLRYITGINQLILLRRMLGVFSFFYILLHFLIWLVIDKFFNFQLIIEDIIERYYILFGFLAFVMLIPLAVTSTNRMVRWLGAKRWAKLHKLVYPISILGAVHFYLQVKADITEPVIYAAILAILLGYRYWRKKQKPSPKRA